jgi:hypothetical protein
MKLKRELFKKLEMEFLELQKDVVGSAVHIIQNKSYNNALDGDNKGNQIMIKMGWKQGQGIGVDSTKVTKILSQKMRKKNSGLGIPQNKHYHRK